MSSETKPERADPLSLFLERDLTAAAEAGALAPAFERDDEVARVEAFFAAGLCPVVTGGSSSSTRAASSTVLARGSPAAPW